MKFLNDFWKKLSISTEEDALAYFKKTVLKTNKNKDYYNAWTAIEKKVNLIKKEIINDLNSTLIPLNKDEFKKKVKTDKDFLVVIRMILLSNDKVIEIVDNDKIYSFNFEKKEYSDEDYKVLFEILELTNFYFPFENGYAKDIKSYLILVLVGMDTNGRKNRSGTNYELNTRKMLNNFTAKHRFKKVEGATSKKIEAILGKDILEKIKKTGKKIPDYVFVTDKNIYLIETNYSDGGSKLQETIKSYIDLNRKIKGLKGIRFIYLTDGKQWVSNSSHLDSGWKGIDYIINTEMVKLGIMDEILLNEEK